MILVFWPDGAANSFDNKTNYVNNNYGYRVGIPAGCHTEIEPPPAPQHGFQLVCGTDRDIVIDASYDARFLGSAIAAALDRESGYGVMQLARPRPTFIDGLPAAWVHAKAKGRIIDILAIYRALPDMPIIYSFCVSARVNDTVNDQRVLKRLVGSFKILPFSE